MPPHQPPTRSEQLETVARLVQQRLGSQFHWMTLLSMDTENLVVELTTPVRLNASSAAVERLERAVISLVHEVMPDGVITVLVHD
jgi:hypothetical protein